MLVPASIGLSTTVLALALMSPTPQEQRFRERQVLDPNIGQWIDQAPEAPGPLGTVDESRRLLAEGDWRAARGLLKPWTEENPDDERYFEAVLLLGETYFLAEDYWNAVERFQDVADNTSGELFTLAQSRCIDCARAFFAGKPRWLFGLFPLPAYDDGTEILDRVWQRAPGTRLGEFALKLKSDFYFDRGEMDIARDEYANLAEQYPSGRYIQVAMLRAAEAAEASFPGIKFDDRALVDAEERYRQFQSTFPLLAEREQIAARLEGIRGTRADKDLDIAKWYERTRARDAAVFYYQRIVVAWPETLAAAEARGRLQALGIDVESGAVTAAVEGSR